MKKIFMVLIAIVISNSVIAQKIESRTANYKKLVQQDTTLNSILFTNIGPTVMSGRVTSIAVNPHNTTEFYVAYASGGVWHTINNGMSFTPIFDKEASITIGAIAVQWLPNRTIWVGTGECNSSRSSYAGTGVYKSIDSGMHWQHLGLEQTQHISKIILHPTDVNVVYVASIGPLYSSNTNAVGIYKTTDGGTTWKQSSFINNETHLGVIDLIIDNKKSTTLYATTWERSRKAWQFDGNGKGSAIYKTINSGDTWQKISGAKSGFPCNDGIGRIGITQSPSNSDVLFALVDNQNRQEATSKQKNKLTALQIKAMDTVTFLKLEDKKIADYLKENGYPKKYNAKSLKKDIQNKKLTTTQIADWKLSDGDAALFQTPVIGGEVYKSWDGGTTWTKANKKPLEGLFFTYGYYFGQIGANTKNDIYVMGYTLLKSVDSGNTFKEIAKENVHADHHVLWINPLQPRHLINGNDGGINITYDDGEKWYKANSPAVAQVYAIAVDNNKPYNVYVGLQDNGVWVGPNTTSNNNDWHQSGQYEYKTVNGGDGMQLAIDPRDNSTVYSGYQFGYYQRSNLKTSETEIEIHPTFDIGEKPLRYNWQTPIALSPHQPEIFYMGSNYFHRSMEKGAKIKTMTQDLTTTTKSGNVPYGTITTISESPLQFGAIYCGTDDGNIWLTKDVGTTFNKLTLNNSNLWVSRIIASKHKLERAYVALNGYRNDDFAPYLYKSEDMGKSWNIITNGLPQEPINVIKEDPIKPNIIYVGTDNGLYISLDTGATFNYWQSNLPRVAIHDLVIQERENEILLGTHGRSIYKASLNNLHLLDSIRNIPFVLMALDSIKAKDTWGESWATFAKPYEPEIIVNYFTTKADSITYTITEGKNNTVLYSKKAQSIKGFNTIKYNALCNTANYKNCYKGDNDVYYLKKGTYKFNIIKEGKTTSQLFIIY